MTHGGKSISRQATLIACLFYFSTLALTLVFSPAQTLAQSRSITPTTPDYSDSRAPDQEKGRAILETIRASTIQGDYYFDFQLVVRPKRGATAKIPGRMWGTRNTHGPLTRITLWPGSLADERQLLIQNGPDSAVWSWSRNDAKAALAPPAADTAPASAAQLSPTAMFEPLAGTDLTAFELQMPFIYWENFTYEGLKAARARPAHTFLLKPPAPIAAAHPELTGVRIYYDTGYNAITVFEVIGPGGIVAKTMKVTKGQLVDNQWVLLKAELLNNTTRNSTDFSVLLSGVKLTLPRDIFAPENLDTPVMPPPLETLWKAPE